MKLKVETGNGREVVDLYTNKNSFYGKSGDATVLDCPRISFSGTNQDNNLIKVAEINSLYNGYNICFMQKKNSDSDCYLKGYSEDSAFEISSYSNTDFLRIIRAEDIDLSYTIKSVSSNAIITEHLKHADILYITSEVLENAEPEYDQIRELFCKIFITDIYVPRGTQKVDWLSLFFSGYKKYLDIKEQEEHVFSNFQSSTPYYDKVGLNKSSSCLYTIRCAELNAAVSKSNNDWRINLLNSTINKDLYTGIKIQASDVVFNFTLHFSNSSEIDRTTWDYDTFIYWAQKYHVSSPADFTIADGTNYLESWSVIFSKWIYGTVLNVFGANVSSVDVDSFELGIPLSKTSYPLRKNITAEGDNPTLVIQNNFANNKTEFYLKTDSSDSGSTYTATNNRQVTPFYLGFVQRSFTVQKNGQNYYAQTLNQTLADIANKKGSGIALAFMVGDEQMYVARTAGTNETPFEKPKTEVQRITANGTLNVSADTFGDTGGVICVCSGKGQGVSGSVGGNGYVQRIEIPANLRENIVIQASFERNTNSNGTTGGTAYRRAYTCYKPQGTYPQWTCSEYTESGGGSSGGIGGMNVTANITIGSKSYAHTVYGGGGGGGYGGEVSTNYNCSNGSEQNTCSMSNYGTSTANGGQGGLTGAGTGTRNNPSGRTGGAGLSYNTLELNSKYAEWTDSACIVVYKYDE